MSRPNIQIDELVREMNDAEYADYQAQQAQAEQDEADKVTAQEARASASAKLSALGLTTEEINAIIGGV